MSGPPLPPPGGAPSSAQTDAQTGAAADGQHASPLARGCLLAYLFLIVYASCYPFSGWRSLGEPPFAFLTPEMPRYWTLFDAGINVLGYIPFGVLTVYVLYPRLTGLAALLAASLAGVLLSGTMEAAQTFLPSRVSSNLDLLTNSAGSAIGALLGVLTTRIFLNQGILHRLRLNWFTHEASVGLVVVGLWPLAQIYPQGYLFGHGPLLELLSGWLSDLLDMDVDLADTIRQGAELTVEQLWLCETIISAAGLCGALLTLQCVARRTAPRGVLALALACAALAVKALASALVFQPEHAFVWLTPAAQGGLLLGLMMVAGLYAAPPLAQRRLAALALLVSLLLLNWVPANPYFTETVQGRGGGKFLNFSGAAQFLSLLWPFLALWFLSHPPHSVKRGQG